MIRPRETSKAIIHLNGSFVWQFLTASVNMYFSLPSYFHVLPVRQFCHIHPGSVCYLGCRWFALRQWYQELHNSCPSWSTSMVILAWFRWKRQARSPRLVGIAISNALLLTLVKSTPNPSKYVTEIPINIIRYKYYVESLPSMRGWSKFRCSSPTSRDGESRTNVNLFQNFRFSL